MEIIDFYVSDNQEHWLSEIQKSDWSAGKYLYELLRDQKLRELCGESTKVLLLIDEDQLLSFCTYAGQDDVREPSLTPWVGFVYTFPEYRGKRHMGKLLEYAEMLAKKDTHRHIYISTGETGLYEKFGYRFWKTMKDVHGEGSRVYRKDIATMNAKLFAQAMIKFMCGIILVGALIFLPAWSFAYWQGWLLMGILFIPMFIAGLVLTKKSPELLQKRLSAREEETEQKIVILLSGVMFFAAFVVAGLNFRFEWIVLPEWVSYASAVVFLAAYVLYAEVLRENAYLSRTVEVQKDQRVIDTGLYGVVRHPMYLSTFLLFLAMPLVLGSIISFVMMLAYIPIIAKRIGNEEKVLEEGLPGYSEYQKKVKKKVIPFIW